MYDSCLLRLKILHNQCKNSLLIPLSKWFVKQSQVAKCSKFICFDDWFPQHCTALQLVDMQILSSLSIVNLMLIMVLITSLIDVRRRLRHTRDVVSLKWIYVDGAAPAPYTQQQQQQYLTVKWCTVIQSCRQWAPLTNATIQEIYSCSCCADGRCTN